LRDEPTVKVFGMGLAADDKGPAMEAFPNGPVLAEVRHLGFRFLLDFGRGNHAGEGSLRQLIVLPDTQELEPRALRQFAPQAELYIAYARSALRILGTDDGTPEERWKSYVAASEALREIAGPGRGHSDSFYRQVAASYKALVAEGEPHPIKALGEKHHITISGSSRWVKEARRRGYIEEATNGK